LIPRVGATVADEEVLLLTEEVVEVTLDDEETEELEELDGLEGDTLEPAELLVVEETFELVFELEVLETLEELDFELELLDVEVLELEEVDFEPEELVESFELLVEDFEDELLVESFELLELPDVLVDELVGFVEELLVVFVEDEEEVVTGFEVLVEDVELELEAVEEITIEVTVTVDPVYPRL
jgi:hypothetical protein